MIEQSSPTSILSPEKDVLIYIKIFNKIELLRDGRDTKILGYSSVQVDLVTREEDFSLSGYVRSIQQLDQSRLACSVFSDDAEDLTLLDLDVDVVENAYTCLLYTSPSPRDS